MHVLKLSLSNRTILLPVRVLTKLSTAVWRILVPELFCCIKGMMENLLPCVCDQGKSLIKDENREYLFLLESCSIWKASPHQPDCAPCICHTALGSVLSSQRWSFFISGVCKHLWRKRNFISKFRIFHSFIFISKKYIDLSLFLYTRNVLTHMKGKVSRGSGDNKNYPIWCFYFLQQMSLLYSLLAAAVCQQYSVNSNYTVVFLTNVKLHTCKQGLKLVAQNHMNFCTLNEHTFSQTTC